MLVMEQISEHGIHPAGLIAAAELFEVESDLKVNGKGEAAVVHTQPSLVLMETVKTAVRESRQTWRIFHFETLLDAMNEDAETTDPVIADLVRKCLDFLGVLHLVRDWWWDHPSSSKNSKNDALGNLIVNIASVAGGHIEVGELREGVIRRIRFRKGELTPPRDVLLEFSDQHSDLGVEGDVVVTTKDVDWRSRIGSESVLVDVIKSDPKLVMTRQELKSKTVQRGINENTFNVWTTYSPYLKHLGPNIWGIRGVQPKSKDIELLRSNSNKRQKRVLDHEWLPNGRFRLVVKLPSESSLSSFVVGIPSSESAFLWGNSFDIMSGSGSAFRKVKIASGGTAYGFGPLLRRLGAEEGDIMVADFDLTDSKVYIDVFLESEEVADDL